MYEDLKEKAIENLQEKREIKRGVHIVGVVFAAVSIILYVVSLKFYASTAYWIKFPILVLALVYGIIYFSTFGIPFISDDGELTDEEIGREIVRIFKLEGGTEPLTENEKLQLKELEALKDDLESDEEFV